MEKKKEELDERDAKIKAERRYWRLKMSKRESIRFEEEIFCLKSRLKDTFCPYVPKVMHTTTVTKAS